MTFNTGDTKAKSTTTFTGVKAINLNAEVLDEVHHGVTLGLGAQYGAFGTSFGINYTGSSNTDSFGVYTHRLVTCSNSALALIDFY